MEIEQIENGIKVKIPPYYDIFTGKAELLNFKDDNAVFRVMKEEFPECNKTDENPEFIDFTCEVPEKFVEELKHKSGIFIITIIRWTTFNINEDNIIKPIEKVKLKYLSETEKKRKVFSNEN